MDIRKSMCLFSPHLTEGKPEGWRAETSDHRHEGLEQHTCVFLHQWDQLQWTKVKVTTGPQSLQRCLRKTCFLASTCSESCVPESQSRLSSKPAAGHTQIFLPFCCQTACCFSLKRTTSDSILKKHKREYGQINQNSPTTQEQTKALVKNSAKPGKMEDHILDQEFHL